MKILIVDDSILIRRSLVKLLDQLDINMDISEAVNVPEAIRLVNEIKPDVAIIDIRIPGGSGFDVIIQAKKLKEPPLILILTKYSSEKFREKALELGANYFFDKSNEFEMIPKIIKSQCYE